MKHRIITGLVALIITGACPVVAWTTTTTIATRATPATPTAAAFCPSPCLIQRHHPRLATATTTTTTTTALLAFSNTNNADYESSTSTSATKSTTSSTNTGMDTIPIDSRYYAFLEAPALTQSCYKSNNNNNNNGGGGGQTAKAPPVTLTRYLEHIVKQKPELRDLQSLLLAIQMACKTISHLINRAGLSATTSTAIATTKTKTKTTMDSNNNNNDNYYQDGRYYSMKRLDQLSTLVLKNALKFTGKCEVVSPAAHLDSESPAQHQPGVLIAKSFSDTTTTNNNNENNNENNNDNSYVAVLDPLDGSGNADASICTGTVFGVFEQPSALNYDETEPLPVRTHKLVDSVLQPAANMRAAGYCLYSSATVLVFSLGNETAVQGFTLDPQINEFVLTHPDLTIPTRGNVYSCNEGNSEGWDENYKKYLRAIKTGQGQTKQRYAHRYVGSMVGDIHRTLLYGGIFAYPADTQSHPDGNLQLLYKTAPMAFVVHHAGGRAIDGRTGNLLQVRPKRVHQKSPCFLGSPDDVAELETYITIT